MAPTEDVFGRIPKDSIIRSIGPEAASEVLSFAIRQKLSKGRTLFEQGDPGNSMVVVVEGLLKVYVISASGREIVLDYIGVGGLIGEVAVLDGLPRTASVVAVEPSEVLMLQRRDLLPYLERNSKSVFAIINFLCERLRKTNALVEDNAALAMGPRLARGLLRLASEHGEKRPGDGEVELKISQSDLGNFVSVSRENVNRQLRDWADEGLLVLSRGRIVIRDAGALEDIADDLG